MSALDLVEDAVRVAGLELALLRPRDSEALLDEHAFEHEEFLPYWAELWPSALALADALGTAEVDGRRVLELGCGLGVPSLVAALRGADVLATDWSPAAGGGPRGDARRAGARLAVRRWSWTEPVGGLGAPWPLVLGADVLYERRNGPQLLDLLPRVVASGGEAWIADPGRAAAAAFFEAAAAGWELGTVPHAGPTSVTIHRLRRLAG